MIESPALPASFELPSVFSNAAINGLGFFNPGFSPELDFFIPNSLASGEKNLELGPDRSSHSSTGIAISGYPVLFAGEL